MNIKIILSDIDRDHFLKNLENLPSPNDKIKELFEFYNNKENQNGRKKTS